MEKRKKLFLSILLITGIADIALILYSRAVYVGTHMIFGSSIEMMLIILLLIAILWFKLLYRYIEVKHQSIMTIILLAITLILPVLIVFSSPNYKYNEGIEAVLSVYPEYSNHEIVALERLHKTVPTIDSFKLLEIREFTIWGRSYYYVLRNNNDEVYFMRNQYTGKIFKLDERYWEIQ